MTQLVRRGAQCERNGVKENSHHTEKKKFKKLIPVFYSPLYYSFHTQLALIPTCLGNIHMGLKNSFGF